MKHEVRRSLQSNVVLSSLVMPGSVVLVLQDVGPDVSAAVDHLWLRGLSLAAAQDLKKSRHCTAQTAYRHYQQLGAPQSHNCHCP